MLRDFCYAVVFLIVLNFIVNIGTARAEDIHEWNPVYGNTISIEEIGRFDRVPEIPENLLDQARGFAAERGYIEIVVTARGTRIMVSVPVSVSQDSVSAVIRCLNELTRMRMFWTETIVVSFQQDSLCTAKAKMASSIMWVYISLDDECEPYRIMTNAMLLDMQPHWAFNSDGWLHVQGFTRGPDNIPDIDEDLIINNPHSSIGIIYGTTRKVIVNVYASTDTPLTDLHLANALIAGAKIALRSTSDILASHVFPTIELHHVNNAEASWGIEQGILVITGDLIQSPRDIRKVILGT